MVELGILCNGLEIFFCSNEKKVGRCCLFSPQLRVNRFLMWHNSIPQISAAVNLKFHPFHLPEISTKKSNPFVACSNGYDL